MGLAVVVGLLLGLMGGGGSILTVPLLTLVAGMDPKEAVPGSLVMVGASSLVAALVHAARGAVAWRIGLTFGAASMVGALAGGLLGGRLPGPVLMVGFAAVMLVSAVKMIRSGRRAASRGEADDADDGGPVPLARVLTRGVGVGLITGVVGAGGGFLIVPALVLLLGLPMATAVGTALLIIAMNSAMGLVGHLGAARLDWALLGPVTGAMAAAGVVGVLMAHRVSGSALKTAFGWFVLGMGVLLLAQQVVQQVAGTLR